MIWIFSKKCVEIVYLEAVFVNWFQLGGTSVGHHRCDVPCLFFFPGYAKCKRNYGDPLRTVGPYCPKKSDVRLNCFQLFSLARPHLNVDRKEDSEVTYYAVLRLINCAVFMPLWMIFVSDRIVALISDPYTLIL